MLLALDIGNTHTVIGLYPSKESPLPAYSWRVATNMPAASDDIRVHLFALLDSEGISHQEIDAAALASVVPALADAWAGALRKAFAVDTLFCTAELAARAGVFSTDYPAPREIGADRVADAIAARFLYATPAVVVDFGTATNIEVIDASGNFVGGIIAPGVRTSAEALFSRATRLAAIDLATPPTIIGRSTEQAIQSGIVFGEAYRVDGLLEGIFRELGEEATVVATGGLAPLVSAHSRYITMVDPNLTLSGLRLFARAVSSLQQ